MAHVKMINGITGTEMSVPENLVEMFKAAGHKPVEVKEEKPAPKKKAPAKRAR